MVPVAAGGRAYLSLAGGTTGHTPTQTWGLYNVTEGERWRPVSWEGCAHARAHACARLSVPCLHVYAMPARVR